MGREVWSDSSAGKDREDLETALESIARPSFR